MSSSIFFRFSSQKEPSRITFDGTGISVFELKRSIIETSNLGDGSDFELTLTSADGQEVYDDDTVIVPRSTVVIVKRRPAARPGRGGAARYVSGKAPSASKHTQRLEHTVTNEPRNGLNASAAVSANFSELSEKQREEAVLKMGADMWKHQQKEMAAAAPVRTAHRSKNTAADNPPPDWYVCNRCGIKGHWIKDCPQNGNPDFDDNRRIKKSIGIPRSRLEVIDKKTIVGSDGNVDSSKLPAGAMIDGDGNYVIVKPDKVTWNKYQEKANKSAAAQEEEARGSRELREQGLECPIDRRLFVNPTKTPCCQATYCNACITNALLDEDLKCPNCGKDGVLIDDLQVDYEMETKIRKHNDEKETSDQELLDEGQAKTLALAESAHMKGEHEQSSTPNVMPQESKALHENNSHAIRTSPPPKSPPRRLAKKRKAEAPLESTRESPGIASCSTPPNDSPMDKDVTSVKPASREPPRGPRALTEKTNGTQRAAPLNPDFGFPTGVPGSMAPTMGMMGMAWDPMAMFNSFAAMGAMGAMYGQNPQQGMMPNNFQQQGFQGQSFNGNGRGMRQNHARGNAQQQYRTFNALRPNPEESAYFRPPVNPHRHQNKRNVPRPTDYREI